MFWAKRPGGMVVSLLYEDPFVDKRNMDMTKEKKRKRKETNDTPDHYTNRVNLCLE